MPLDRRSDVGWQDEALRLRDEGLTVRAIAEVVGMSKSTVGKLLRPHFCVCGKERHHRSAQCRECWTADVRWRKERVEELVAGMFDDGWPLKDIAAVLGRTMHTPRDAGRAIGPELDSARARGLVTTTRVRTGYGTWAPA